MFDLAKLNTAEAFFDLELTNPATREPLGLFIKHRSINAPEVQAVIKRQGNEVLLKDFQARRKGKDGEAPTVDDGMRRATDILVAGTVEWYTMERDATGKLDEATKKDGFQFGKERLLFDAAAAAKLYGNPGYRWLRDQYDESLGDAGNFIAK